LADLKLGFGLGSHLTVPRRFFMAMAIYRAWAVTVVLLLVSVGEARDPNLQTDDPNGSGQDFDSRGAHASVVCVRLRV